MNNNTIIGIGLGAIAALLLVYHLVVIPNTVDTAIAERDMQWQDSLNVAPIIIRDTTTITEPGKTVSRHDTIFIREATAAEFYSEIAETLASDNASVSFTLRETVNRETGDFAHSFEDIRFKYPRITNTVAVNAPPVAPPTYQGIGLSLDFKSTWKTFQPALTPKIGLKFLLEGTTIFPHFYARIAEYQTTEYGYGLTLSW